MSLDVRARLVSLPGLRRRLSCWTALLLCAGSCLNPQPDSLPTSKEAPPAADGTTSNTPNEAVPLTPAAGAQSATPPSANPSGGTPEAAPATPVYAPTATPGAGGVSDAGALPPVDAGAADAAAVPANDPL